jgi:hypothetical protein
MNQTFLSKCYISLDNTLVSIYSVRYGCFNQWIHSTVWKGNSWNGPLVSLPRFCVYSSPLDGTEQHKDLVSYILSPLLQINWYPNHIQSLHWTILAHDDDDDDVTLLGKIISLGFVHQPSFLKLLHFRGSSMVWRSRYSVHLKMGMELISKM